MPGIRSTCSSATSRGVTFGWGVVFSDQTVDNLMANDPVSGAAISAGFAHWDDIEVHIGGECLTSSGHGFIGIGRKPLLDLLVRPRRGSWACRCTTERNAIPTRRRGTIMTW